MIDEEEKSTTRALITVTTRGRDSLASLFVGLVERLTSGALCGSASVFFPLLSFITPRSLFLGERHFRVTVRVCVHVGLTRLIILHRKNRNRDLDG